MMKPANHIVPSVQSRALDEADRSTPTVEIHGLKKSYDLKPVLRGIDLMLYPGERVALLGANGTGKTTILRILAGLTTLSAGSISVDNVDIRQDVQQVRRLVGFVAHQPYLYEELTALENLLFFGRMYGVDHARERAHDLLRRVGLERRDRVSTFSRGQVQRLAWARALLHSPRLLLLDEADSGLDQEGTMLIDALIAEHTAHGGVTLFTTHQLERVLPLSTSIVILRGGCVAYHQETTNLGLDELKQVYESRAEASAPRVMVRSLPDVQGGDSSRAEASATPSTTRDEVNRFIVGAALASAPHVACGRPRNKLFEQVGAILWKDLRCELRSKQTWIGMGLFALLVLVIFNFAFDLRVDNKAAVAPGALWVAFIFASLLGLGRTIAAEREHDSLDRLLLCPVDRKAIYLAKLLGNLLCIGVVEIVALPVFAALFDVPLFVGALLPIVLFSTLGIASVGTLFSAMAAATRARELLLPILVFPLIVPIVISAVRATENLIVPSANEPPWLGLIIAFDIIFLSISMLTFAYVIEE